MQTMSRPGSKSLAANRRAATCCWPCRRLLCAAAVAWAGRPVRVYEVDVAEGPGPRCRRRCARCWCALPGAVRRPTIRRSPALVSDAPKYLKSYATGPRGESQAVFDAEAVEQAISCRRTQRLGRERPFTLVVLIRRAIARRRKPRARELERAAAAARPADQPDPAGARWTVPASPSPRMRCWMRRSASAAMSFWWAGARATRRMRRCSGPCMRVRSSKSWSGSLAAGIDHTVDHAGAAAGGHGASRRRRARLRVEIDGVRTLADYAAVGRLLRATPGVRRAESAASR